MIRHIVQCLRVHTPLADPIGLDSVLGEQQPLRGKLLICATSRGFLKAQDSRDRQARAHGGGFSLEASALIPAYERDALERLLRYCARPAFA